jgi:hypothetical protein
MDKDLEFGVQRRRLNNKKSEYIKNLHEEGDLENGRQ